MERPLLDAAAKRSKPMRYLPSCATTLKFAVLTIPVVILACSSGDSTTDAGSDATLDAPSVDSGTDTGVDGGKKDSGVDSGLDSSTDANDASQTETGTDAEVDTGADTGTDAGLDASVTCGSKLGYGFATVGDSGVCGSGVEYTCNTDYYQIECDCPSNACWCKKDDAGTGAVSTYGACPKCGVTPNFSALASGCGIPF